MNWLLYPEVLSLTIAIMALVGVIGLAFAFGVRHRLAWAQLPAAARDAELASRVTQRETELLDKDRRLEELNAQIRDREAQLLERDKLESEAEFWRAQLEAARLEYNNLGTQRAEIEQVREEYRQALENLADAERQAREAKGDFEDVRTRLAESERRLSQIADDEERLRTALEDTNLAVADAEAKLAAIKVEKRAAQEELERAQADVVPLRRELATLEEQNANLQKELGLAEGRLEGVKIELERLEPTRLELDDVNTALSAAKDDLNAKQEAVSRLSSEEAWLNAQIARKRDELGELTGEGPAIDDGEDTRSLADLLKPPVCLASGSDDAADDGSYVPILSDALTDQQEQEALHRVRKHLAEIGLIFDERVINAFHTSLKTAVISPLTVLAGISGTGKSQLPRFYAEAMGMHFLKIPVQPRWDGPQDLFGFYNYIERRYKATDLARALVHLDPYNWPKQAAQYKDRMLLVLLDEMNLARVEYYFSEFLSRLEGRPQDRDAGDTDIRRPAEIEIDVSRKGQTNRVYAGQNVLFVGTMNEDESTLSLSDKVLDRANMLRFPKPKDLKPNLPSVNSQFVAKGYLPKSRWTTGWMRSADGMEPGARERAVQTVAEINAIMDGMGRPFGHRMGQAMLHYVANYPADQGHTNNLASVHKALADQIELRILPRLRGVLVDEYRNRLSELADVAKKLDDDPLSEAIAQAVQQSRDTNGLFVWRSFARA